MIIIDTSVLIAKLIEEDEHHERAIGLLNKIASSGEEQAITYGVLVELGSALFALRNSEFAAQNVTAALKLFNVIMPTSAVQTAAFYSEKHEKLSFVDCEIILTAKLQSGVVASFDRKLLMEFKQLSSRD